MSGKTYRCTNCGRYEFRLIAPNYVECGGFTEHTFVAGRQVVGMQVIGFGPTGMPHHAPIYVPVYEIVRRPCKRRRHQVEMTESSGWPECLCGTFAIGRCFVCQRPVCGDDSQFADGVRVCVSCHAGTTPKQRKVGLRAVATLEWEGREALRAEFQNRSNELIAQEPPETQDPPLGGKAGAPPRGEARTIEYEAPRSCVGCSETVLRLRACDKCSVEYCWKCLKVVTEPEGSRSFVCPQCVY
jgi:hypothetical protein